MMGGQAAPSEAEMEKMQAELAGLDPNALPPDMQELLNAPQAKPMLPGLGAQLPGLGGSPFKGFPGFGKKK